MTYFVFIDTKPFLDENFREEYMKPGFENFENSAAVKPSVDVDLDGEIYADQLHSLLQRISPDLENMRAEALVPKKPEPKRKLTDEEKVMDMIHCIDDEENNAAVQPFKKPEMGNKPPNVRIPHYGGAFEGVVGGPKTYRQTFSYQMIRKPDGTYATSTVVDPSGNTKTVIKRTVDGETKTQTLINGVDVDEPNAGTGAGNIAGIAFGDDNAAKPNDWIIDCGRHFYVNKAGYALPKNLFWLEIWQLSIKRIASIYSNYQALVVVVILLCLSSRNQVINITNASNQSINRNINPEKSTSSKNIKENSRSKCDKRLGKCTFIHVMIITTIRWKQLFIKFYLKFDYLKFDHFR